MWLCVFLHSCVCVCVRARACVCVLCRLNDRMYIYMCVQGRGHARGWQGIGVCGLGNQGRLLEELTLNNEAHSEKTNKS